MAVAAEVMVRTYLGQNQWQAAQRFGEDVPKLADEGWVPGRSPSRASRRHMSSRFIG